MQSNMFALSSWWWISTIKWKRLRGQANTIMPTILWSINMVIVLWTNALCLMAIFFYRPFLNKIESRLMGMPSPEY